METTVRFDPDNYLQTSDRINQGFEKAVGKASKTLGEGGILGVVDVHERRFAKFKEKTLTHVYDNFRLKGIGPVTDKKEVFNDYGRGILHFTEEDITVLRGVRTFTPDNSMSFISYGLQEEEYIKRRDNMGDMLKEAKDKGAITISHQEQPITHYFGGNRGLLELVDGMISHSGSAKSQEVNKELDKFHNWLNIYHSKIERIPGKINTSGGHSYSEIGTSFTEINKPDYTNADTFIESLRTQIQDRYFAIGKKQKNTLMPIIHAIKLFTPKVGWVARSQNREVIDDIAQ